MRRRTLPAFPSALAASLVLATALSGCGGDSSPATGASASAPAAAVVVKAGDTSCEVSKTALTAGLNRFTITNTGSKATEVYLYAAGDTIVAEKENIGPGLTYELTAQVPPGSYEVACKPSQSGKGIRTAITATASAGATAA